MPLKTSIRTEVDRRAPNDLLAGQVVEYLRDKMARRYSASLGPFVFKACSFSARTSVPVNASGPQRLGGRYGRGATQARTRHGTQRFRRPLRVFERALSDPLRTRRPRSSASVGRPRQTTALSSAWAAALSSKKGDGQRNRRLPSFSFGEVNAVNE